jgi:hypothetical protein
MPDIFCAPPARLTWPSYRELVAAKVIDMADGDAVTLSAESCGNATVRLHRQHDRLALAVTGSAGLPFIRTQRAALASLGWCPVADGAVVWLHELPPPISRADAMRVGGMVVDSVRDILGVADIDQLEIDARNLIDGARLRGWAAG